MKIGSNKWTDLLLSGAEQLALDMDRHQALQFGHYAQILLEWNQKFNITSITDPKEIAVKHFLDSLAPSACIPLQGSLLDIGTGGGFPGIPNKICRPHQPMVLIDGARKKVNFVKHVIRQLDLTHIQAQQVRAENLVCDKKSTARFDIIVSRALADLDAMIRLAAPLLKPLGRLVFYKGPHMTRSAPKDKIFQHANDFYKLSILTYRLPFIGDRRTVVVIEHIPKG